MGLGRFELPTPRLSSVCSNQLSYRPSFLGRRSQAACSSGTLTKNFKEPGTALVLSKLDRRAFPKPSFVSDRSFKCLRPCGLRQL